MLWTIIISSCFKYLTAVQGLYGATQVHLHRILYRSVIGPAVTKAWEDWRVRIRVPEFGSKGGLHRLGWWACVSTSPCRREWYVRYLSSHREACSSKNLRFLRYVISLASSHTCSLSHYDSGKLLLTSEHIAKLAKIGDYRSSMDRDKAGVSTSGVPSKASEASGFPIAVDPIPVEGVVTLPGLLAQGIIEYVDVSHVTRGIILHR